MGIQVMENLVSKSSPGAYTATGRSAAIASNRLSYVHGLEGPSMSVDTACSSALVALDVACHSLQTSACTLAVTAGVNVLLSPDGFVATCKAHMLSPEGRCKTFDASADGYSRAEGCCAIALQSKLTQVEEALGKCIINSPAINQDGRTANLTSPNGPAQQRVISRAIHLARASACDVAFVDAHGTGTALGDPIEVSAHRSVFANSRSLSAPLLAGAAKSLMGHLEAGAGMVGLLKVILSQHSLLSFPNLHLKKLNSHISAVDYSVLFPTQLSSMELVSTRLSVGVSSFGFGGTNSHVLVTPLARQRCSLGTLMVVHYKHTPLVWQNAQVVVDCHPELAIADVGIMAMEYYAPSLSCAVADIEQLHSCPGRYTVGRGQEFIGFCADDEDAVSMAMTVFTKLVQMCSIKLHDIGRLEVGTESQVDRAKSIKTFLMAFFENEGLHNVEGADTYNACYGGTNALFNTANWLKSATPGQLGVVVCSDPAVHPAAEVLSSIGASSVAMLIGVNGPAVLDLARVSFIKHCWDFYRPVGWHNNDALVDMDMATAQYEEALLWCQQEYTEVLGTCDLLHTFGHVLFHCNAPYHSKRNLRLMCDVMYGQLSREQHEDLYVRHVASGVAISAQNATTYTCPLYACLISLAATKHEVLVGSKVLCFSYGSGCAASMFGIEIKQLFEYPQKCLQLLAERDVKSLEETMALVQSFEDVHRSFPYIPTHQTGRIADVYYLEGITNLGIRSYTQLGQAHSVNVQSRGASVVELELLGTQLTSSILNEVFTNLRADKLHIITQNCNTIEQVDTVGPCDTLELENYDHSEVTEQLGAWHSKWTVGVCQGVVRCGTMPLLSDTVIATVDARFIFRTALDRQLTELQPVEYLDHFVEELDATAAYKLGLVDCVCERHALDWTLNVLVEQWQAEMLTDRFNDCVETEYGLDLDLVDLSWPADGVAQLILSNCNSKSRVLEIVEQSNDLNAVMILNSASQPIIGFSQSISGVYHYVHVITSLAVPILAVLSGYTGRVSIIDLAVDWRVATVDTVLQGGTVGQPAGSDALPKLPSATSLLRLGVVSDITADRSLAIKTACCLGQSLGHAPSLGLGHTLHLTRLPAANTFNSDPTFTCSASLPSIVAANVPSWHSSCSAVAGEHALAQHSWSSQHCSTDGNMVRRVICNKQDTTGGSQCAAVCVQKWAPVTQAAAAVTSGEWSLPALCSCIGALNEDLVKMELTACATVVILELNDARRYNALDLSLSCVLRMQLLRVSGTAHSVVLQGAGPHFCSGGSQHTDPEVADTVPRTTSGLAASIAIMSDCIVTTGQLEIPVLGVLHGKVVGGGIALAMNSDWRLCTGGARFNHGNMPRNHSPIGGLGSSFGNAVGVAPAQALYIEDTTINAVHALTIGLVSGFEPGVDSARASALKLAWSCPSMQARDYSCNHMSVENLMHAISVTQNTRQQHITGSCAHCPSAQQQVPATEFVGNLRGQSDTEVHQSIMQLVCEKIQQVVAAAPGSFTIGTTDPLMERGVDSLASTELFDSLQRELGAAVKLPSTLVCVHSR